MEQVIQSDIPCLEKKTKYQRFYIKKKLGFLNYRKLTIPVLVDY
jgi:hypothetical protein